MPKPPSPIVSRWFLIAGLVAGISMAATGVLETDSGDLPAHAVARVNDRLILRDAWLRAVAGVSSERRTPLTEADKRHVLERLIDEELLTQHGLALGLVEQDRRLRGQLVQQVMQTAIAGGAGHEYSDDELRAFYVEHQDFFTVPARLRLSATRIGPDGRRSAFIPPVPDVLLPPAQLRNYLGPALTRIAMTLQPGGISEPLAQGQGSVVLEMLEREVGRAPPFEQVREQVQVEMQRRADEEAVRHLLGQLREDNRVVIIGDLE